MDSHSATSADATGTREIVTLVDRRKLSKLRAALDPDWRLRVTDSWPALVEAAGSNCDVLVLDPPLYRPGESPLRELMPEVRAYLSTSTASIVIYTTASNAAACVAGPRLGRTRLIIEDLDDYRDALRFQLGQAMSEIPTRVVATAIRAANCRLDDRVLRGIEHFLETGTPLASVGDFARFLGMSRTALYRYVEEGGVRSPLAVVNVLRATRLYRLLTTHRLDVSTACRVMGDGDIRSLRRAVGTVLDGRRMRELGLLSPNEFARLCVDSLKSSAED